MTPAIQRAGSMLLAGFLGSLLLCMMPVGASGKDINLSLGVGVEYATGKYGSDVTTDSLDIPFTVRYEPTERFDLELVVPYIYQSNGSTTSAGMLRFRNGRSAGASAGSGRDGRGQPRGSADSDIAGPQNGIGDVSIKAGYIVAPEDRFFPHVKPLLYVKFPTGDEDKGLGTGEYTGGVGMELAKNIGDWYAYAEGIYNFQGTSTELGLKDFFSYETGLAFQMTDRFRPAILLKGATAPSEYTSALAELRFKTIYRLTGRASLEGFLAAGLAESSPDFGAGLSVFYDF